MHARTAIHAIGPKELIQAAFKKKHLLDLGERAVDALGSVQHGGSGSDDGAHPVGFGSRGTHIASGAITQVQEVATERLQHQHINLIHTIIVRMYIGDRR